MKAPIVFMAAILSSLSMSCKHQNETADENIDEGFIKISKAQFDSEGMEIGKPDYAPFSEMTYFTGAIVPSVNGLAQISAPVPGLVKKIYCQPGQRIDQHVAMFEISGNEIIDLQKDYAESAALYKRMKSEFDRALELSNDNIGSKKELMLAETAFSAEKAKLNALSIKLKNIGLDIVTIEDGTFYTSYLIKSSIKGHVNAVHVKLGQYIETNQTMAEIIQSESLQLALSVFEKDVNKVSKGQNIEFYLAGNKNEKYTARITSVGKSINVNTKSVDCYAEINQNPKLKLVSNQFVEGEVLVNTDSAFSVSESSILSSEGVSYVLEYAKETPEAYFLKKTKVIPGRINDGRVEISGLPDTAKILTQGIASVPID
jgi:cobalt-zinc-cadmium efflux system membrane fusion protein